ncbi:MAG: lycopene cyclase domain-containing protein [Cyclobacteriaceae bacterium]|nr:lycopene cyclase domain-containing protein [Cyclobacteriaceae bacterium]
MNEKYLYLAINFFSILFPFLFSFYPKSNFSKKWRYLWLAILVPGLFFIVWDEWFTRLGVWGFNPQYLTGTYLFSLPLEEVLFFVCIPYACVFTYEAVNYLIRWRLNQKYTNLITDLLSSGLLLTAAIHYDRWYTAVTFMLLAIFLLLHRWVWKTDVAGKFYVAYLFILIPFFIVNGILTGTGIDDPVVWYNDAENLGIRMGTIPFEDTFYGMLLLMMNVTLFEFLQKRKAGDLHREGARVLRR